MRVAAFAMVMTLTGCKTVPFETDACLVFEPICASRSDTEDTIKQVIGHNAAFEAMCGRIDSCASE